MTNLLLSCVIAAAAAEEPKEKVGPSVKPSGTIFFHYAYDLTEGSDGYNEFALDRAYFRLDGTINERFGGRITLDADQIKPVEVAPGAEVSIDTKYRVFVKHAYLEVKDLGPTKLKVGIVETPYVGYFDNLWGNRYIAKAFTDEYKVLNSADLGISLSGKHAKGVVDWSAAVLNGEGYGKLETDAGKAAQARLTIDPLAPTEKMKLPITAFAGVDGDATNEQTAVTAIGAVGFEIPRLLVWGEYVYRVEGDLTSTGYSGVLNPRLPKYLGLLVRYDHFDPAADVKKDGEDKLYAGLEKEFGEKVAVAAMYERGWTEAAPENPEHGIYVHLLAGF